MKLKVIKKHKDIWNTNQTDCEFNKPNCEKLAVYKVAGEYQTSYLVKKVMGQFIQKNPCCKSCIKWIDNAMYKEATKGKLPPLQYEELNEINPNYEKN